MCKCGLEYTRKSISFHNKKDEHKLYISKLNVKHYEQKIFYRNKNYEIINDDNEIMRNCKNEKCIQIKKHQSKIFYCEICNKEMKMSSKWHHLHNSEEHKKNMKK